MALKSVWNELVSFSTCCICTEDFQDREPRCLPCLHAFCSPCIEAMLNTTDDEDTILCPVCQKRAYIPNANVRQLPTFFYSQRITDAIRHLERRLDFCKACSTLLENRPVVSYCFQCTTAMCTSCKQRHDLCFDDHSQVPVSSSNIRYVICEDHEMEVNAFCRDCREAICRQCLICKHWQHSIYQLTDHPTQGLEELIEELDDREQTIKELLTKIDDFKPQFNEELQNTKEDLYHHYVYLLHKLEEQYKSFYLQLDQKQDKVNTELDTYRKVLEESKQCIGELRMEKESLRRPLEQVPGAELAGIDNIISDLKSRVPHFDASFEFPKKLRFIAELSEPSLGVITDLCSEDDKSEEDINCFISMSENEKDVRNDPALLWRQEEGLYITDVAPLSNGRLLVALDNYGLFVYDNRGTKVKHSLSGQRIQHPEGISVDREGKTVAIVESRASSESGLLHVYKMYKRKWRRSQHRICTKPRCVIVTENGEFVVAGSEKPALFKYDKDGCQLWKKKTLSQITAICVDKENRLVTASKENVLVRSSDGDPLFSVWAEAGMRFGGVCMAPSGNIFASDQNSGAVLEFDGDGRYIMEVLKVDQILGLIGRIVTFDKRSLAVIEDNNLYAYRL